MTLSELERLLLSKVRINKLEAQRKAEYDYIQASLIIRGVGMVLGSKEKFPSIQEVYPSLYDEPVDTEAIDKKNAEVFAIQLQQFAKAHNDKLNKEVPKD